MGWSELVSTVVRSSTAKYSWASVVDSAVQRQLYERSKLENPLRGPRVVVG